MTSVIEAMNQADEIVRQASRVLSMCPAYGIYNEVGMVELRKAICAWLGVEISEAQAHDAKGWADFIKPHLPKA